MEQALSTGQHQLALFFASARLGAHVARADGQIANAELVAIGAYFSSLGWPQQSLALLMVDLRYFVNLDDDEEALSEAAHVIRKSASSPSELEAVAFMVSMVACADGVLRKSEKHALEQIRLLLGLTAMQMDAALKSARASFRNARGNAPGQTTSEKDHLETLGLSPGATQPEIRKAYIDLAQKYHPDKVEHMGEDLRKAAEERFKSIQAAYDALRG